MFEKLKVELEEILLFLKNNYNEVIVISVAVLCFTLHRYFRIDPSWLRALIYYLLVPIFTIIILLRKNPLDFGLRLGNYRIWRFHVFIAVIIAIPVLYFASKGDDSLNRYYTSKNLNMIEYTCDITIKLLSWEFLLRGFLLFGLKKRFNETSILIQTIPFVILHFNKPLIEVLACIPMGLYFGFVAYRGDSFWPAFIIHLFINLSLIIFTNL